MEKMGQPTIDPEHGESPSSGNLATTVGLRVRTELRAGKGSQKVECLYVFGEPPTPAPETPAPETLAPSAYSWCKLTF